MFEQGKNLVKNGLALGKPMKRLSAKILISIVVFMTITIVVIYLAYLSHREFEKTVISQTQQELLTLAKTTANGMEEFFAEYSKALKVIAMNSLFQERVHNKITCNRNAIKLCPIRSLYEVHKNDVDAITLLDENGIMLDREPFIDERIGMDHTDKPGVTCVIREQKPCISEVFYNNLGNLAISISEPIFYKEKFAGIARWMIETDTVSMRFIESIKIGNQGYAWMFDNKNVVLSHPRKDFVGMTVLEVIKKTLKGRGELIDEGSTEEHIREKHDYLNRVKDEEKGCGIFVNCATNKNDVVAYEAIQLGRATFNLLVTMPYSEIVGPIRAHERNTFGIAGLVIILLGAGGLVLLRSEKRKTELETEAKYLKQIANGSVALRESEERLKKIMNGIHAGILVVDSKTHVIVDVNPCATELIGASREKIVGHVCHKFVCPVEKGKCPVTDLKQGMDNSERILINAQGESIPILKTVTRINLDGSEYLVESFLDISDRKQSEEEREKLIKELQDALSKIKTLSGLLPICSACKKIRDDKGYWNQIEAFIRDHSEAEFSHSICPECAKRLYPNFYKS